MRGRKISQMRNLFLCIAFSILCVQEVMERLERLCGIEGRESTRFSTVGILLIRSCHGFIDVSFSLPFMIQSFLLLLDMEAMFIPPSNAYSFFPNPSMLPTKESDSQPRKSYSSMMQPGSLSTCTDKQPLQTAS